MIRTHAKHRATPARTLRLATPTRRHRIVAPVLGLATAVLVSGATPQATQPAAAQEAAAQVAVTAAAPATAAVQVAAAPTAVSAAGTQLVVNGTFSQGSTGWFASGSAPLQVVTGSGSAFARFAPSSTSTVVLNDQDNTVGSAAVGTTYTVSAQVRAATNVVNGQLRVREVAGTSVKVHGRSFSLRDNAWQTVSFSFTTTKAGATLDLNVLAWGLRAGRTLDVDNVSMVATTEASTPAPTPTPTPSKSATPTPTPTPTPTETEKPSRGESRTPTPTPTPEPSKATSPSGWVLVEDVDLSRRGAGCARTARRRTPRPRTWPKNVTFSDEGLRIVGTRPGRPTVRRTPPGTPRAPGT